MPSTDPLALILAAGSAVITMLLGFVVALVSARASRVERKIDDLEASQNGRDGTWTKLTGLESWARGAEARVKGLEESRLTAKEFEQATRAQNERLEGLKAQAEKVDLKIERLDRTLMQPPSRSFTPPDSKR